MKEFKIGNYPFSEWTNKMLEKAEEMAKCELSDWDVLALIDYMAGYVSEDEERLDQALEAIGLYDDENEDEDED